MHVFLQQKVLVSLFLFLGVKETGREEASRADGGLANREDAVLSLGHSRRVQQTSRQPLQAAVRLLEGPSRTSKKTNEPSESLRPALPAQGRPLQGTEE